MKALTFTRFPANKIRAFHEGMLPLIMLIAIMLTSSCRTLNESLGDFNDLDYEIRLDDLNQPWSMKEGPDGILWITNNVHVVSILDPNTYEFAHLKVDLPLRRDTMFAFFVHGLAIHPNFGSYPFVYLSYMYIKRDDTLTGHMDVVRLSFNGEKKLLSMPTFILKDLHVPGSMVMGGRLLTSDDHLFITTADEREDGVSQDIDDLRGKILRFNLDGSIPEDNPFPGNPVYSYGHRNPQGLAIYKDKLYSSEHGPSDNDEINLIIKGGNYGWPLVTGWGNTVQEKELIREMGIKGPIYAWTPTIAPSSLGIMEMDGRPYFILTTLKEADIRLLKLRDASVDAPEESIFLDNRLGRLRDVCVTQEGRVFILTYNRIQKNFKYGFIPSKTESYDYDLLVEVFFGNKEAPEQLKREGVLNAVSTSSIPDVDAR